MSAEKPKRKNLIFPSSLKPSVSSSIPSMATRRASPLDVPPAVPSSDEEEETSSEGEETSNDEQVQATLKPTVSSRKTKKTDDDSESDADSSSESEPADSTVKPMALKPMEEKKGARSKPSVSKPSVAATPEKKSAAKRPREYLTTAKDSKKRVKKKTGPEVPPPEAHGDGGAASDEEQKESKKSGGADSKKLFQRLWSEGDEIVILKGLLEYAAKRGGDPATTDMNALHDFIKKSLHVEVTKVQLSGKVRKLKQKYSNNAARKKYNPTKPHEQNVFELSKKIWGGRGSRAGVSSPKSNAAAKSNRKATLASPAAPTLASPAAPPTLASPAPPPTLASPAPPTLASPAPPPTLASPAAPTLASPAPPPTLASPAAPTLASPAAPKKGSRKIEIAGKSSVSVRSSEMIRFGMKILPEEVVKKALDLLPASKKAELDAMWKKLRIDELELFLKKNKLMNEQVMLVLEKLKSSDP